MSDANGVLLFYTDGDTIFDASQHMMLGGSGISFDPMQHGSSTQGALIVPQPGSDHIYYVFTLGCAEYSLQGGFRYSVVDMDLNNGLGAVTSTYNWLAGPVLEKMAAIHHSNGVDVWVLVHEHGSDAFLAYLVTASGISTNPVISHSGVEQILPTYPYCMSRGYMKFSPDGNHLVVLSTSDCHSYVFYPQLFSFDDSTGVVTLDYTVADPDLVRYYGASFSPSSELLYFSTGWHGSVIHQFDATATDSIAFLASKVVIADSPGNLFGALQIGPDGRIYIARSMGYVDVIDAPDQAGTACGYVMNAIRLLGCTYSEFGLPNFIESYFRSFSSGVVCPSDSIHADFTYSSSGTCIGDTFHFTDLSTCYPEDVGQWHWNFNDPGSGPNNTSDLQSPTHAFASAGLHEVRLRAGVEHLTFACKSDTLKVLINVDECTTDIEPVMSQAVVVHGPDGLPVLPPGTCTHFWIVNALGQVQVQGQGPPSIDNAGPWLATASTGIYYLQLQLESAVRTIRLVVE